MVGDESYRDRPSTVRVRSRWNMTHKSVVALTIAGYIVLLSAFVLVDDPQTQLWFLVGAIAVIAETSGYFVWSLGIDSWRDLEDSL